MEVNIPPGMPPEVAQQCFGIGFKVLSQVNENRAVLVHNDMEKQQVVLVSFSPAESSAIIQFKQVLCELETAPDSPTKRAKLEEAGSKILTDMVNTPQDGSQG